LQDRAQLRSDREHPYRVALVSSGLSGPHHHPTAFPVHVTPPQGNDFGRAWQLNGPAQGHDRPPLGIGAHGQGTLPPRRRAR
jgi:hypothetical protein